MISRVEVAATGVVINGLMGGGNSGRNSLTDVCRGEGNYYFQVHCRKAQLVMTLVADMSAMAGTTK